MLSRLAMHRIVASTSRTRTPTRTSQGYVTRLLSESAGSSSAPPGPSRLQKYARRAGYFGLALGAGYLADRELYASTIARNARTFWTCAIIAADYKMNFKPGMSSEQIVALHTRVADRLYDLLTSNGGLYIKFGQAIAANAALLPHPIQVKFARLFDDAPQIPYSAVESVFLSEFGKPPAGPDGVFAEFEEQPVASASIAQVHRARVRETGEWVAVKVQKPAVATQMEPDLAAFGAVLWMYEHWFFDMPVYFLVDFINAHLRQELDFENEARNAARTAGFVAADARLRGRVYIPTVYAQYTTARIMTAEWIEGTRLSDREGVAALLDAQGVRALLQTMTDLFSAQIFRWGWVHCDPHPGNIIVRTRATGGAVPAQLVLLDHGLYVHMDATLRRQYAELWKGLLAVDLGTVRRVAEEWGIGLPELFASAVALRPVKFKKEARGEAVESDQYAAGVRMKEALRHFLKDTDRMPKELVFIGRNMRMMQGNNQMFGSPVNRIKTVGLHAADALARAPRLSYAQRMKEHWHHGVFLTVMCASDVAFYASRLRRALMRAEADGGFEDELQKGMEVFARDNFGVEVSAATFEG